MNHLDSKQRLEQALKMLEIQSSIEYTPYYLYKKYPNLLLIHGRSKCTHMEYNYYQNKKRQQTQSNIKKNLDAA
ncbi:hypothetical protein QN372_05905 [Undibacterium sp. RTI2.1]|uniref:hypothetical protein n=1 Tax=unclassified Undibacterium TaxID=2630295 RepID=UPI002AB381BD|nr:MULTISPECIES: hypothetical protein [unclassified Undibacterium]MDY7538659.1 hypothetical protein [Undibacterium sp. 5I1]MEB0030272.1 hypothetical protein [Undibacterium sp. RTI2.1]MEB0116896.1 hypothetical protein [Undibacterium sp. RTI2.2]MEB0232148.1 hypothetical protein [Undibacterium sp. 10I3]